MRNRKKSLAADALRLALLMALAAFWAAGCGRNLSYHPDTDRKFIYRADLRKGLAGPDGISVLPGMGSSSFHIIVPVNRKREGTDIKAAVQPVNSSDYAMKLDLGADSFTVTPKGEILNRIGPLGRIDWSAIFINLPGKRSRIGDKWSVKTTKYLAQTPADMTINYTLEGFEKKQGRRCARIRIKSKYAKQTERLLPSGIKVTLDTGLEIKSVLWFSPALGMPVEATHTEITRRRVINVYTGQQLANMVEVSELKLRLEPRTK